MAYGAIVTFLPSVPRFVVGDATNGLMYTVLRGASFATATLLHGDKAGGIVVPFFFGFAAPITLGIIDLATTPRAVLLPRKPGGADISPIALTDNRGKTHGAMLTVGGLF